MEQSQRAQDIDEGVINKGADDDLLKSSVRNRNRGVDNADDTAPAAAVAPREVDHPLYLTKEYRTITVESKLNIALDHLKKATEEIQNIRTLEQQQQKEEKSKKLEALEQQQVQHANAQSNLPETSFLAEQSNKVYLLRLGRDQELTERERDVKNLQSQLELAKREKQSTLMKNITLEEQVRTLREALEQSRQKNYLLNIHLEEAQQKKKALEESLYRSKQRIVEAEEAAKRVTSELRTIQLKQQQDNVDHRVRAKIAIITKEQNSDTLEEAVRKNETLQEAQGKNETLEEAQRKNETLQEAQRKNETLEEAQRKIETLEVAQRKNETLEEAQRKNETLEEALYQARQGLIEAVKETKRVNSDLRAVQLQRNELKEAQNKNQILEEVQRKNQTLLEEAQRKNQTLEVAQRKNQILLEEAQTKIQTLEEALYQARQGILEADKETKRIKCELQNIQLEQQQEKLKLDRADHIILTNEKKSDLKKSRKKKESLEEAQSKIQTLEEAQTKIQTLEKALYQAKQGIIEADIETNRVKCELQFIHLEHQQDKLARDRVDRTNLINEQKNELEEAQRTIKTLSEALHQVKQEKIEADKETKRVASELQTIQLKQQQDELERDRADRTNLTNYQKNELEDSRRNMKTLLEALHQAKQETKSVTSELWTIQQKQQQDKLERVRADHAIFTKEKEVCATRIVNLICQGIKVEPLSQETQTQLQQVRQKMVVLLSDLVEKCAELESVKESMSCKLMLPKRRTLVKTPLPSLPEKRKTTMTTTTNVNITDLTTSPGKLDGESREVIENNSNNVKGDSGEKSAKKQKLGEKVDNTTEAEKDEKLEINNVTGDSNDDENAKNTQRLGETTNSNQSLQDDDDDDRENDQDEAQKEEDQTQPRPNGNHCNCLFCQGVTKLPIDWRFPKCTVQELWTQWWLGVPEKNYPPLRTLKGKDVAFLNDAPKTEEEKAARGPKTETRREARKTLSEIRQLMRFTIIKLKEAGALENEINAASVHRMFQAVAHLFDSSKPNKKPCLWTTWIAKLSPFCFKDKARIKDYNPVQLTDDARNNISHCHYRSEQRKDEALKNMAYQNEQVNNDASNDINCQRLPRLPSDWRFPRLPLPEMWRQWWLGEPERNVPPLRTLKITDVKFLDCIPLSEEEMIGKPGSHKMNRRRADKTFYDLTQLMKFITIKVEDAGALVTEDLDVASVDRMFEAVAHIFGNKLKRKWLTWSTKSGRMITETVRNKKRIHKKA